MTYNRGPVRMKLLERVRECPGLPLSQIYKPFLNEFSKTTLYEELRLMRAAGCLSFGRSQNHRHGLSVLITGKGCQYLAERKPAKVAINPEA